MATILEHSKISPPRDMALEFSLPLTFFDMLWYNFEAASQNVLFYDFPCSKSRFVDKIVPQLKASLSITLGQFLPLAGNIIHPLDTSTGMKPILRYVSGDSVSFTVSESRADSDLDHLTGNHPRDCDQFYAFAPDLPPPDTTGSENLIACPVLAVQVTLFPEKGLSIGLACLHAVADASTVVAFRRAWAMNNNNSPDNSFSLVLPSYDRKTVNGPLDSVYWDDIVKLSSSSSGAVPPPSLAPTKLPTNKFRATFVLKRGETENLKAFVSENCSQQVDDIHVSSITVMSALIWVSSAKSAARCGDDVADDEPEYFSLMADCRRKVKPPLPENYFGNCVRRVMTELKHGQLVKEMKKTDGFLTAAKAMGKAVKETMNRKEKGVLEGAENWVVDFRKLIGKRLIRMTGSPRFDNYSADYGWGKAKKYEILFIDSTGSFTIIKSREFEGGFEIGVSMTKLRLDAFAHAFQELLADLIGPSFVASRI